jgi:hypothetical protein
MLRSLRRLVLCTALVGLHAQAFELVTPELAAAERVEAAKPRPDVPASRSVSLGPRIQVLSPALDGGALKAPLRIELKFEPVGEAKVNPASLKVLYGFLGVDLTDKIRGNATVNDKGVLAEKASIPAGSHKLRIQVMDSLGRLGETEIKFKVEG